MKKTERALRIIAGCEPAWVQWRVFFPDTEIPARDKSLHQSVQGYQDYLSARVRIEACRWLGKRLNSDSDVDEAEYAGPAPEILS